MKKTLLSFVILIAALTCFNFTVMAEENVTVVLDGETIVFDVLPQLINGRTMVPMRAIFEKLGAVVDWNDTTRTAIAQKGNTTVSIVIDDTTLYKNSEPITLDVPAQLKDSRTLVPLRAVSEAFDCEVVWNDDTQTVRILSSESIVEQQKSEAIDKLINWVNNNSNYSLPPYEHKAYMYKQENYEIAIIPNVGGKNLNINCLVSDNNERTSVCVWLLDARFGGSYSDTVNKTWNSSEGDIIKSSVSNSLELNCDWYTGDYIGDKNILLGKYKSLVNIILKLFDNFLKTNYVGLTLEDFDLDFDLSSVVLNNNETPVVIPAPSNPQNNTPNNSYQGGSNYSTNTKITLSSFPLYLYADDGTGTFLGEISSNKYDRNSIANEYGNYGSKYQTKSIFNQYGDYGSQYSNYSAFNKYATKPPKILNKNGKVVGYLTANKYIKDAVSYEEMMVLLKKFNK